MEIPYEDARAEYFGMLNSHVGGMLKDLIGLKALLNLKLALGRFVQAEWLISSIRLGGQG